MLDSSRVLEGDKPCPSCTCGPTATTFGPTTRRGGLKNTGMSKKRRRQKCSTVAVSSKVTNPAPRALVDGGRGSSPPLHFDPKLGLSVSLTKKRTNKKRRGRRTCSTVAVSS